MIGTVLGAAGGDSGKKEGLSCHFDLHVTGLSFMDTLKKWPFIQFVLARTVISGLMHGFSLL